MTPEPEIDLMGPERLYLQVAALIAWRIRAGTYAVRLPSERALAAELGVSYVTLRHATEVLQDGGMVRKVQGRGTFVLKPGG